MKLEEDVYSDKKLADALSSSELKALFANNNDTAVAITKLLDIFYQSFMKSQIKTFLPQLTLNKMPRHFQG